MRYIHAMERCCCWVTSVVSDSVRPQRWQPTRLPRPWDSPGKNTGVGCHFLLQCMKVKSESEVAQSCLTLSDPMDCSLPGSSIHGIFQARVLEWGATVDLEIIILSEVRKRKTNIIWYHLYVESKIWHKWSYLQNRNRLTDVEDKFMITKRERAGEG